MRIKRVLVSQPTPQILEKSPFYDVSSKYDVEFDFYPFIKLEGVSLKEFRAQRVDILGHSAVIFTSRVTIDIFFRICEESRIIIPEDMKYFCNTEAVALYLQKYIVYRKRKIFFSDGTFAKFIELILKHKSETFMLTLSEPHKPEMPMAVEKFNLKCSKAILARTVSNDLDNMDIAQYDALVFYSPSEINALTTRFPDKSTYPHVATFGHGTTKAAIDEGIKVSVMAPMPSIPSMAKAVDILINQVNTGEEIVGMTLLDESPDIAYIEAQQVKGVRKKATEKPLATKKMSDAKATIRASAPINGKVTPKGETAAKAKKRVVVEVAKKKVSTVKVK